MSKPKVFIPRVVSDEVKARLGEVAEVVCWTGAGRPTADAVVEGAADADAVLGYPNWTAEMMDKAPKVKILANTAVGFDGINVAAATERGIIVTNTPGVLTDTTADTAFSLLMAAGRRIAEGDRLIRAGRWGKPGVDANLLGRDIHHATLGIVGLGRIGVAMAKRGLGFSMKVLYYDAYRREDLEQQLGLKYVDLDTLLRESDFITLHVNLTEETRGMINAAAFAKMKPTAILVNASRGGVVDEKALIAALTEKRIAGAGLDVFEKEPTPADNPLLKLENAVFAPHLGSATAATRQAMLELAVDNVIAVLQGKAPITPVNPEVLSKARK